MPHLLSPLAGLLALLTLAAPLLLHLWRPPARTVRLGSLRFLPANAARRRTHLRFRERTLLLVRLASLALLAALVARAHWRPSPPTRPQRWALLDTPPADGEPLARLRALRAAGYETRRLAPGFPAFDPASVPTNANVAAIPPPDLWSLLRELDARLPAGSTLAVFAPGRLAALRGERPTLSRCRVEWIETPAPAAVTPRPERPPAAPPRRVLVLAGPGRDQDARRLEAAARAAAGADARETTVSRLPADPTVSADELPAADWIFWLGPAPPPNSILRVVAERGADLFSETPASDPAAPPPAAASWIVPAASDAPGAEALAYAPARLWRQPARPVAIDLPAATLWTDGAGTPLLTISPAGRGRHWRFHGRLADPAWSDLAGSTALPAALRSMLGGNDPPPPDLRLAGAAQSRPAEAPPGTTAAAAPPPLLNADAGPGDDLHGSLWALAALGFAVERGLSLRRRPASIAQPVSAAAATPLSAVAHRA